MKNKKLSTRARLYLSDDFLFKEILPRVPTKSILRFKSVSKSWLARISSDSAFIADHAAHRSAADTEPCSIITGYYKDEPRIMILGSKLVEIDTSYLRASFHKREEGYHNHKLLVVGSRNGLVCLCYPYFGLGAFHGLVVWNPATREFTPLPLSSPPRAVDRCFFGIDEDCNDYKVVRLEETDAENNNGSIITDVHLFTKSSGRWRQLNSFSGFKVLRGKGTGLTVDGKMHWAIRYENDPQRNRKGRLFGVLSFDVRAEEFEETAGPATWPAGDNEGGKDEYTLELMKWKGSLAAWLLDEVTGGWRFWYRTENDRSDFRWTEINIGYSLPRLDCNGMHRDQLVLTKLHEDLQNLSVVEVFDHRHTIVSPN